MKKKLLKQAALFLAPIVIKQVKNYWQRKQHLKKGRQFNIAK